MIPRSFSLTAAENKVIDTAAQRVRIWEKEGTEVLPQFYPPMLALETARNVVSYGVSTWERDLLMYYAAVAFMVEWEKLGNK